MSAFLNIVNSLVGVPDFDPNPNEFTMEKVHPANLYHPVFGDHGIVENPRLNMRNNFVPVKPDNGIGPEYLASEWRDHPLITPYYKANYVKRKGEYMDDVTSIAQKQLDPNSYALHRSGRFFTNYGTGERRHTLTPNEVGVNNPLGFSMKR